MENSAFYNVSVAGKVIPAALILFRYHLWYLWIPESLSEKEA